MKMIYVVIFLSIGMLLHASNLKSVILEFPKVPGEQIEIVMVKEKQSLPLLIFLHGASMNNGAQDFKPWWYEDWISKGYAVAAVSLPGYGKTTGRKDFCGPHTMQALNFAIDFIKNELAIPDLGIIAFGQGSLAGILLSIQRTDIRCLVCANGGYDFLKYHKPGDTLMKIIVNKNYDFDVNDLESLRFRSALQQVSSINAPMFVLHREGNPTVTVEEVSDFVQSMQNAGKECHYSIRKKTSEFDAEKLTYEEVLLETEKWVDGHMQKGLQSLLRFPESSS